MTARGPLYFIWADRSNTIVCTETESEFMRRGPVRQLRYACIVQIKDAAGRVSLAVPQKSGNVSDSMLNDAKVRAGVMLN
jgi:hypothetical protein